MSAPDAQASEGAVGEVAEWALDRVGEICGFEPRHHTAQSWWWTWQMSKDFARYIAAHEPAPVDPLRIIVNDCFAEADRDQREGTDWVGDFVQALRARLPAAAVAAVEGATDV